MILFPLGQLQKCTVVQCKYDSNGCFKMSVVKAVWFDVAWPTDCIYGALIVENKRLCHFWFVTVCLCMKFTMLSSRCLCVPHLAAATQCRHRLSKMSSSQSSGGHGSTKPLSLLVLDQLWALCASSLTEEPFLDNLLSVCKLCAHNTIYIVYPLASVYAQSVYVPIHCINRNCIF